MSKNNIIDFKNISKENTEISNLENSNKKKKNRLNFKNLIFIAIAVILTVYPLAYIANQISAMISLKENITTLETELEATKVKNKTIKEEIAGAKSNEFIEKMAREKLKMVKKDEIVYIKID